MRRPRVGYAFVTAMHTTFTSVVRDMVLISHHHVLYHEQLCGAMRGAMRGRLRRGH
jgi:hypothetical protein